MDVAQLCRLARVSPPIHQKIGFSQEVILNPDWLPLNQVFFETLIS